MRGTRLALLSLVGGVALAAPVTSTARAATPPTPPPVTTVAGEPSTPATVVTTAVAGEGNAPSAPGATSTTVLPATTLPRAGAAIGDLNRHADEETWNVRRLVTATALGIAALALAGYVYGRLQSVTPRVGRTIS